MKCISEFSSAEALTDDLSTDPELDFAADASDFVELWKPGKDSRCSGRGQKDFHKRAMSYFIA
jgi:hypothetical protein